MRTEGFKRGAVSILLVFGLLFSMISIAPLASSGNWINRPAPGGTIIEVVPGDNFLIRHTLEWNEPEDGAYAITIAWDSYDNEPSENFTFLGASAYFTTGPHAGQSILAVVELGSAPMGTNTMYALSVKCPPDQKDSRNGQFNVDITLSASGVGGVPHIVTDNHPIPFQFAGIIIIESSLQGWNRDPITIRVLPKLISISPNYQSGLPGTTLEYIVTVTNIGENVDNFDLIVSDSENWGPTLDDYRFENITPSENKHTTLSVTIPRDTAPCTEDNITVTVTSQADNAVSDNASCRAHSGVVAVEVSISPIYRMGLPRATLTYLVVVKNTGNVADNYALTVSDDAVPSWGPSLLDNLLENIGTGEKKTTTLAVKIPENALPGAEDEITVTATSMENAWVSDNASCVARVQGTLGMVSYWKFDEGSGNIAYDSSDYGNHGTIHGATWTTGKVDDALSFDGDGDYVWVSDDPSLDISEKITIEAWVNITDRSDFRAVVVKQGNYHFRIHNGYLGFVFWTTSGWRGAEDDTTLLDTLTWYHIAVSFDTVNDVIKFYVNGNNVKTITNVWDMITNDNPFTIGRQTGALYTNYFNGIIDEIRIYNRALSPDEISQHYLGTIGATWDAFITATFSGGSDDALFGVRPDATDNFDSVYDIPEPPAPPEPPYVRAYFYYPRQTPDELHRSSMAPEDLMGWPLRIEYAEGLEDITLTWNVEDVPVDYSIFLYWGENLVADMRDKNSYTFEATAGSYDFRIVVGKLLPFTLELAQGWNMISFPVLPENSSPNAIFDGYYVLYRWDAEDKRYMPHADSGSFIEPDPDVEPGVGYWAYVLEDENVDLLGVPVYQLNLSLRQGWNLIGPPYGGSSIADLADDPDDSVLPHAFTWNSREKSYSMTQLLEAGKGYWVYALQPPQPPYPAIVATSAKHGNNEIRINVLTGSIPWGEWAYSVSSTEGSYSWIAGTSKLAAPYVSLGTYAAGTYYVSLKHIDIGHFYFYDQTITIS